jgi:hypothetical protein
MATGKAATVTKARTRPTDFKTRIRMRLSSANWLMYLNERLIVRPFRASNAAGQAPVTMRRGILTAQINVTQDKCLEHVFLNKLPDCNAVRQCITTMITLVM